MKKDPLEFYLVCSNSLNMNYTEFSFIRLVKLNIGIPFFGNKPLISQVREIYGNGLIFGWAKTSVCYPLWTRKNEKRHSSIMMGKLREGNYISFAIMVILSHLWTWHLFAFHSNSWVFILSPSQATFMGHVTPLSLSNNASSIITLCLGISLVKSMLPSIQLCRQMFKGKLCW